MAAMTNIGFAPKAFPIGSKIGTVIALMPQFEPVAKAMAPSKRNETIGKVFADKTGDANSSI